MRSDKEIKNQAAIYTAIVGLSFMLYPPMVVMAFIFCLCDILFNFLKLRK